jgi:truncated hemoglobin YjbI
MKFTITVLSLILCNTSPILLQGTTKTQPTMNFHSQLLDSIVKTRSAYEIGKYDDFLQEMDTFYQKIQNDSLISDPFDIHSPDVSEIDRKHWKSLASQRDQQENREFLTGLSLRDHSHFAENIRNAATDQLTSEEKKAWLHLARFSHMAPTTGKNSDENRLIDLDLEYEYKMIHLESLMKGKSSVERREKQHILRMQTMDRMVQASQSFEDDSLKLSVHLTAQSLNIMLASRKLTELYILVYGEENSQNDREDAPKYILGFSPPHLLGVDYIAMIRFAYENNEYDSFLKELDDFYLKLQSKRQFSIFADIRSSISNEIDRKKWEYLASQLQSLENRELLKALPFSDLSFFAEKVRNAATDPLTLKERNAWLRLARFRHMASTTGKNSDENCLIDLDIEYEYKMIHLDTLLVEGRPAADRRIRQHVLKMQEMDRIVHASQIFEDDSLKEAVRLSALSLDSALAQAWDLTDLKTLSINKENSGTDQEKNIFLILACFQEKFNELSKQFID